VPIKCVAGYEGIQEGTSVETEERFEKQTEEDTASLYSGYQTGRKERLKGKVWARGVVLGVDYGRAAEGGSKIDLCLTVKNGTACSMCVYDHPQKSISL